ncbi:hypothetical protein EG832_04430, partial [bacterium]|nr:hypothetical protein [bacterium]
LISLRSIPVLFLLFLLLPSCQKDEISYQCLDGIELKNSVDLPDGDIFFGPEVFTRNTAEPFAETRSLAGVDYNCYSDLALTILNGKDKATRVSSAEIWIDGVLIAGPSDFSKNVYSISKPIQGLSAESSITVKLNSQPGSFLEVYITGTLNLTEPLFSSMEPVVQDSDPPALPLTSENGITGTWSPEIIDTETAGFFSYTFTPDPGQCASTANMIIEITNKGKVADNEGNIYNTVKIGTQWWMSENLNAKKYRNGDVIGTTVPATMPLGSEVSPKYEWAYDGSEENADVYGRLYTYYTVADSRGVCPEGWHVATSADWTVLKTHLIENGYGFGGSGDDIAKSLASTSGWYPSSVPGAPGNDQQNNNSSEFTARPGGFRQNTGGFVQKEFLAVWWSFDIVQYKMVQSGVTTLQEDFVSANTGLSVRCVKN